MDNAVAINRMDVAHLGRLIARDLGQGCNVITLTRVLRTVGLDYKLARGVADYVTGLLAEGDRRTVLTLCLNALNY